MNLILKNIFKTFPFLIILSWFLVPYFSYSVIIRFLFFFSVLFLIIKNFDLLNKKILAISIFIIIYTFILNYLASNSSYLLRHLQLYIFLFSILIAPILTKYTFKESIFLIYFLLVLNLFSLILTYKGLLLDSHASRAFSKSNIAALEVASSGVGGYGFIYANVLLYPILILIYKTINNKKIKILSILNFILILLVISRANFFIAIILTTIQLFYFFYNYGGKTSYYLVFIAFIISLFYVSPNLNEVIDYFDSLLKGGSLYLKFLDIISLFEGKAAAYGTTDGRTERYIRSFLMMFKNPFIGVMSFDDIGKHSQILDLFAQFGFIIGIMFMRLIFFIPIQVKKIIEQKHNKLINIFIFALLFLGMFNNYAMQMGIVIILLVLVTSLNSKIYKLK